MMTSESLRLVIFDCDGVLVDSEGPANRLVAAQITALGWPLGVEESLQHFMGMSLDGMVPVIERHLGRSIPSEWPDRLRVKMLDVLAREVEPMPGAAEVLRGVTALGLPYRIASNSSHQEMKIKFCRCGLVPLVKGRVHSARDVARSKPAPDVYLLAARVGGVAPADCLVVEDSVPGTEAARAAGMAVLGLVPHGDGADLAALGATIIRSLDEVVPLARTAMQAAG